ncbi:hypothetical protein SISNIDRAFT_547850 [Sistotremastrum niveocremeum HHB9708]|uniref:DUF6533 domain-containing protein n=1 Tax=Sistotremastrum niveocremeum HHB9708 TaxID=1314777 RepID=A0A164XZX4_9AGAM|nr:hypothetical protein SISNIDRAFT_547850 [Sistotremastrum niveocremeum HHB9708]
MSVTIGGLIKEFINAYEHYNIGKQTRAAALTVLLYDWMLTFDREVKYFWVKKLSIPKIFYFASRYLTIVAEIFNVAGMSGIICTESWSRLNHSQLCSVQSLPRPSLKVNTGFPIGSSGRVSVFIPLRQTFSHRGTSETSEIFIVQMVLTYRIYAIYERDRRVLMFLSFLLLCTSTAATATVIKQAKVSYGTNQPVPGIYLCDVTSRLNFLWAYWIPILIFETVVFGFMAYKALSKWKKLKILRHDQNPTVGAKLIGILFYDSFTYYICVLVLFTMMTFVFRYASESVIDIMTGPVFAIISILANRMLLNLPTTYDAATHESDNLTPLPNVKPGSERGLPKHPTGVTVTRISVVY